MFSKLRRHTGATLRSSRAEPVGAAAEGVVADVGVGGGAVGTGARAASVQYVSEAGGGGGAGGGFSEVSAGRFDDMTAALDWSQCPAVERVPGRVSGAWVLRDTRMPISVIFENLAYGSSIEEIIENYGVTLGQVQAVLEFAAKSTGPPPMSSVS